MKKLQLILTIAIGILLMSGCEMYDFNEPGYLVPKTVDEDPELPAISVNGTLLHSESFGDKHNPIMIFLHGGPGSDYRDMISEKGGESIHRYPGKRSGQAYGISKLRDEFYCVFYDQRGAGLSPRFDKGEINFDIYLEDLRGVIEYTMNVKKTETGIKDSLVYIFGYSYGGLLATGFINKYPHLVKDVIFYEPAPISKEIWEYFKENSTQIFGQLNKDWLNEYISAHEYFTPNDHIHADYQMMLVVNRAQPEFNEDENNPMWRFGALVNDENVDFSMSENFDITSNLNQFTGNAFLIYGSLTKNAYPEYLSKHTAFFQNIILFEIDGVGHTGVWQKPDDIIEVIKSNINK